jgi:hypothetical protein
MVAGGNDKLAADYIVNDPRKRRPFGQGRFEGPESDQGRHPDRS